MFVSTTLWGGKTSMWRLVRRCGVVRSTPDAIGRCLRSDAVREPLGNDDIELTQVLSTQRSSLRGDGAIEKINGDRLLAPIARVVRVHEDVSVEKE